MMNSRDQPSCNEGGFNQKVLSINSVQKMVSVALLLLGLSACGGGGGETVAAPLDPYLGTWVGCADAEKMTVNIERASSQSLELSLVRDFFTNADCSGEPVGTASFQDPTLQLTHQKTESILLEDPLTYAVKLLGSQRVDVFEATAPAGTITLTGALDADSCFVGTGVCFDPLSYPKSSKPVALHLEGDVLTPINLMRAVSPEAGQWYADEIAWTRVD